MGEAYNLKAESIVGNRVMFPDKNGERRVVPISDDIARIIKHRESGRLFRVSYKTFRLRMKEAKPNLPDGQAAHAAYVRNALHDEGGQHHRLTATFGSCGYFANDGLRTLRTRLFTGCCEL